LLERQNILVLIRLKIVADGFPKHFFGWTWLDLGAERAALVVFGRLMNVTQRRETMVETERIRPHQAGRERPKRGCAGKDRAGWRLFRAFINHFSFLLLV
jgi:hypothetical protein